MRTGESTRLPKPRWLAAGGLLLGLAFALYATLPLKYYRGSRVAIAMTGDGKFQASVDNYAPSIRHNTRLNQFEVGLYSGEFVLRQTDLFVPGAMPIALTRTWHQGDKYPHAFGTGTNHPYDIYPMGSSGQSLYSSMQVILEDEIGVPFRRISPGAGYGDAVFRHEETGSEFLGAQISWNGNGWNLRFSDRRLVVFPDSYHSQSSWWGGPTEIRDAQGNRIVFQRAGDRTINKLVGWWGHNVSFQYDSERRITAAWDDAGNVRRYRYDATGHLDMVGDANRVLYRFVYTPLLRDADPGIDEYLMTEIAGGDGKNLARVAYDKNGRVAEVNLADGSTYRYRYEWGEDGQLRSTTVTFPNGEAWKYPF